MNVNIKSFDVAMGVKNKGVEFDVTDTSGKHIGDLIVTKTGLVWCKGKTRSKNGIKITWDRFIKYMENK